MRIIDLTLPLHPSLPVYPGDSATDFQQRDSIERDDFTTHRVCLSTHAGTHVDAPAHRIREGIAIDHSAILRACVGKAVLREVPGEEQREIVPGDIRDLKNILASETRLVLRTGWSSRFGASDYYGRHPVVSPELAGLLAGSGIRFLGVDTPSVESGEHLEVHTILLGAGIVIAENLASLDLVPEGPFFLSAAPLRLTGLDGSPVRAYALLEE